MTKANIFSGAAAESRVATRLFDNGLPVWFEGHANTDTDLITRLECGHLCSIQVKLAHYKESNYSFHSGEYINVDFYAVVCMSENIDAIIWVPTELVEANYHAALTDIFWEFGLRSIPWCKQCSQKD